MRETVDGSPCSPKEAWQGVQQLSHSRSLSHSLSHSLSLSLSLTLSLSLSFSRSLSLSVTFPLTVTLPVTQLVTHTHSQSLVCQSHCRFVLSSLTVTLCVSVSVVFVFLFTLTLAFRLTTVACHALIVSVSDALALPPSLNVALRLKIVLCRWRSHFDSRFDSLFQFSHLTHAVRLTTVGFTVSPSFSFSSSWSGNIDSFVVECDNQAPLSDVTPLHCLGEGCNISGRSVRDFPIT